MTPKVIALEITCFKCLALENLTEWFIRPVLEEFALVGYPAEHASGEQLATGAGLIQERGSRTIESAKLVGDYLLIDLCGL